MGHKVVEDKLIGYTIVTAILKWHGHVEAAIDPGRYGSIAVD